jgi:hypothetical protein
MDPMIQLKLPKGQWNSYGSPEQCQLDSHALKTDTKFEENI